MNKLITNLLARADSSLPFRTPVDYKALQLFDFDCFEYPKISQNLPTSRRLGIFKMKLDKGRYNDALECAEDIQLV